MLRVAGSLAEMALKPLTVHGAGPVTDGEETNAEAVGREVSREELWAPVRLCGVWS